MSAPIRPLGVVHEVGDPGVDDGTGLRQRDVKRWQHVPNSKETRLSHANAPLTSTGRLRLVRRCVTRPVAHVAAAAGVSRQCLSTRKARWDALGEAGLVDRSLAPHHSPRQLDEAIVTRKWSARLIAAEFVYAGPWTSEAQRADCLQRWLIHYNCHRAHTAIGDRPRPPSP